MRPRDWLPAWGWAAIIASAAAIAILGAFGMFDGGAYAHNIRMAPWQ